MKSELFLFSQWSQMSIRANLLPERLSFNPRAQRRHVALHSGLVQLSTVCFFKAATKFNPRWRTGQWWASQMRHWFNIRGRQRNTQLINNECSFVFNGPSSSQPVWERKDLGFTLCPALTPLPVLWFPNQASLVEPLINKESGRGVNQGQWAWTWPRTTEDQCVWTQLIRGGP